MEVNDIFDKLLQARVSHLRWVAKAEALVEGVPLDKDQVPLLATDCEFGQWYHGVGRVLRYLPSYEMVTIPHQKLHRIYMDIFKLLYSDDERNNILQWLGVRKSVQEENRSKAKALLPQLKAASKEVLAALDVVSAELNQRINHQQAQPKRTLEDLETLLHDLQDMGYGEGAQHGKS